MEALLEVKILKVKGKEILVFIPVDFDEESRLKKKFKPGDVHTHDIFQPQKGNLLRQLMVVTRLLYDNYREERPPQVETFREAITISVGATTARKQGNKVYERAMSWSPRLTDNDTFKKRIYNPIMSTASDYLGFEDEKDVKGNVIESARDKLIRASMERSGYDYDKLRVLDN